MRAEERYHVPPQAWEGAHGQRGRVHLHVLEPFAHGRYRRQAEECLCPKKRGSCERPAEGGELRCERCAATARRFGIRWPSAPLTEEESLAVIRMEQRGKALQMIYAQPRNTLLTEYDILCLDLREKRISVAEALAGKGKPNEQSDQKK